MCLVQMNGRIYDPTLGRFLQADPHIQAPTNSQNFNRYSYVLNNPLSYTDPSGYFFKKLFKGIKKYWRQIVSIGMMFIPGMQQFAMATWYNAAAVGFVSGGIATGSLRGALIGAFSGAALQQIGSSATWGKAGSAENIIANASVGGIAAELNGGKFGHGFLAAGVTASFKPHINKIGDGAANYSSARVAAAAVVGGTASVISGGKFANGAVTGAFVQMFNGETALAKQRAAKARAEAQLKDSRVKAMLEMIAEGESNGRYNVRNGGETFDSYDSHPGFNSAGNSAAGKYQFIESTWNALAARAGLTDFSPHNQDLAAAMLLDESGATYQLMNDNPIGAISRAARVWEALPYSVHSSGDFGLSYHNQSLRPSFQYLQSDYHRRVIHGN